eukprot:11838104-Prorocentrum_lima.AAC.1
MERASTKSFAFSFSQVGSLSQVGAFSQSVWRACWRVAGNASLAVHGLMHMHALRRAWPRPG